MKALPHPYRTRVARATDLEKVHQLERISQVYPTWHYEVIEQALSVSGLGGSPHIFRVVEGPKSKGKSPFLAYIYYRMSPDFVDIERILVHPKHRHNGIGSGLLSYVYRAARKRPTPIPSDGRRWIRCRMRESQLDLQMFFKSLKFTCEKVESHRFGAEDGYCFLSEEITCEFPQESA